MAMADVVRKSIKKLDVQKTDRGAAALAIAYAEQIDEDPSLMVKLGPLLLATMESLLMTPRARASVVKGGGRVGKRKNPLDELRQRRAARERNAEAVDPAAP